jgi:hypothetical protein
MRRGFLEQRFAEHGHGIHDLFAIVEDEKNGVFAQSGGDERDEVFSAGR